MNLQTNAIETIQPSQMYVVLEEPDVDPLCFSFVFSSQSTANEVCCICEAFCFSFIALESEIELFETGGSAALLCKKTLNADLDLHPP